MESFDHLFHRNYVYVQAVILLVLGGMLGYVTKVVADASGTQKQLAEQIKRLADMEAPTISEETQTIAQEALKDTGLTPEQSKELVEIVAKDLGSQMARDSSGEVKRKVDEWKDAVTSKAPAATVSDTAAAVQPLLERAVARAAGLLGLPAEQAQKALAKITSLGSEVLAVAGRHIVELIVEDAYKFMRELIVGADENSTICNCCACRAQENEQRDDDQPPIDAAPAMQRVVVHFSTDQYSISYETQREQIWLARMMYRQITTAGKKLHLRAYTDSTGSEKWNGELRLRRVQSVRAALTDPKFGGFDASDIEMLTSSRTPPPVEVNGKESIPSNRVVIVEIY